MSKQKQQLSPHRHISFTAHYTGYNWYKLGLSNPTLATSMGRLLYNLLNPFETITEKLTGQSIRYTLKERHRLIDRQLDQLIAQHPNLQVIEIAAGLSPRGWSYRQTHPEILYIEIDLPAMAEVKQQALTSLGQANAPVIAVDLFSPEFERYLKTLDSSKPLVIISEGLVNYFSKDNLAKLWSVISHGLKLFPAGYYLTDLYPEPKQNKVGQLFKQGSKVLKLMSRSDVGLLFNSPAEASAFFKTAGFKQINIFQPTADQTPDETEHLGDLLWVVEASV